MTLKAKNHSDPLAGPSYCVFYRPEWVFIEKTIFSSKVFILQTVGKIIEN